MGMIWIKYALLANYYIDHGLNNPSEEPNIHPASLPGNPRRHRIMSLCNLAMATLGKYSDAGSVWMSEKMINAIKYSMGY